MKRQIAQKSANDMLNAFEYKLYQMKANQVESATAVEAVSREEEISDPYYRDEIWIDDDPEGEMFEDDEEPFEEHWELIARRDIKDSDGFMTEYSLYGSNTGRIVTVYGDSDIYRPENGDIDEEFDNIKEAEEFFYDFDPFGDEEETW